jgi:hypothetical protein
MIKFFTLFFYILSILPAFSQNQMVSSEQLVEDAEFYFQTIEQVHPNPYAYKSIGYVERFKKDIIDQLTHIYDLDKDGFLRILTASNHCFDAHTYIHQVKLLKDVIIKNLEAGGKILPPVQINGDIVCMVTKEGIVRLTSINEIPVGDILSSLKLYVSSEHTNVNQSVCEYNFPFFLLLYRLKGPFELEGISANGGKIHWTEDGLAPTNPYLSVKAPKYRHVIFETDSVAVLEFNSFSEIDHDKLRQDMTTFFDSLQICGVKHLFVNLIRNGGGKLSPGLILLDNIKHDTVFYTYETVRKVSRQTRDVGFKYEEEDIGKMVRESYHKSILLPPRPVGYTGKVYFLQGLRTRSAADQFCRIIAQNPNIGIRVGRETGTPLEFFSYTFCSKLPNTGIEFCCPIYYYNIPVPTARNGFVYPDIAYPLEYKNLRDVNQLKKLLTHINNNNQTITSK